MKFRYELGVCIVIGSIGGWFIHSEYMKRYVSEWKQIENRQVKVRIDKPIKIVVQKHGCWYAGSEKDVFLNQK